MIPRAAPHVSRGQDALRAWVRERYPQPCWTCGITELAAHVGDRRLAARALGERELDEKLAPAARALLAAKLDPQVSAILMHIEEAAK